GGIRMCGRIDSEARVELDLEHGELWQSALDRDRPVTALEPLAACRARDHGVRGRPAPIGRRILAVEPRRVAAEILGEPAVGRMDVEPASLELAPVPEDVV